MFFDEVSVRDRAYLGEYASDGESNVFFGRSIRIDEAGNELFAKDFFRHGVLQHLHLWILRDRFDGDRISFDLAASVQKSH